MILTALFVLLTFGRGRRRDPLLILPPATPSVSLRGVEFIPNPRIRFSSPIRHCCFLLFLLPPRDEDAETSPPLHQKHPHERLKHDHGQCTHPSTRLQEATHR